MIQLLCDQCNKSIEYRSKHYILNVRPSDILPSDRKVEDCHFCSWTCLNTWITNWGGALSEAEKRETEKVIIRNQLAFQTTAERLNEYAEKS